MEAKNRATATYSRGRKTKKKKKRALASEATIPREKTTGVKRVTANYEKERRRLGLTLAWKGPQMLSSWGGKNSRIGALLTPTRTDAALELEVYQPKERRKARQESPFKEEKGDDKQVVARKSGERE